MEENCYLDTKTLGPKKYTKLSIIKMWFVYSNPLPHQQKMLDWPLSDECERFKTIIANSGLATSSVNSMLEHGRVAISAFVERLYPETDTFCMPFGEMTITPDDVVQIINLPDQGTAVKLNYTKQLSWAQLYALTKKCLGWDEETSRSELMRHASYRTRQIYTTILMNMFRGTLDKEKKGTLTDEQVNHAATLNMFRGTQGLWLFQNAKT